MNLHFEPKQSGDVCFDVIPAFERTGLVHTAFSTRLGGVSKGQCASMNLGFGRGDERERVLKNYELFCKGAGFSFPSLVLSRQVHKDTILTVGQNERGTGLTKAPFEDADGLMTDQGGYALSPFTRTACPFIFSTR